MNSNLIELRDLNVAYDGKVVLNNVNITVTEDDFIGVIGPNGGGKTTLVKVILGLLKPISGKVIKHRKDFEMGYLPQYNDVDKRFPLKACDVVLSGLMNKKGLFGRYSHNDYRKACESLEKMGVSHLSQKHIGSLSGGETQKVLLARAIVSDPALLILDEPDTYVDYASEGEIYDLLKRLNEKMAIIMVSHDLGIISTYIKTIACVNKDLHYHASNIITEQQLQTYNCPIQLVTHGKVPHTVLANHVHTHNHK
ncbi:MAG: zinc ABC transporter ATP-binding protein [Salinivirgaceae bacterium]|nr:MAG: zinc ABC transporter ATP-binding protein [Salinivirgaceae bacterium]